MLCNRRGGKPLNVWLYEKARNYDQAAVLAAKKQAEKEAEKEAKKEPKVGGK